MIIDRLEGVPKEKRTARFVCAMALAEAGKETVSLQSLLSTISSPSNVAILSKPKNFGTSFNGASNLLEGILHDIRSIVENAGTDDICKIKEI